LYFLVLFSLFYLPPLGPFFPFITFVYGSQLPVFLLRRVPFGHLGFLEEDFDEEFEEDLDLGGEKSGE
jgi:hypothetical protein